MTMSNPEASSKKCVPQETYIGNVELAHAYVPFQILCDTFTPLGALTRGTAFPPLLNVYVWGKKRKAEYDDE